MTIAPGGHGRPRCQRTRRGLEAVARGQHGVEDPVELPTADVRAEPSRVAVAERDDTGTITAAQRALHHLNRAAHDAVGGLRRRPRRLRIPVNKHHHVGGAVGQPLA